MDERSIGADMTEQAHAVVVIPTYNERDNLERLVKALRAHAYRVLVVDDASPDGTGDLADTLSAADPMVSVVHRTEKAGLGPAYAHGFAVALEGSEAVVCQMDADFSHDPDALPELVAHVVDGADLAIGSRYVPGGSTPDWKLIRRLISRGGNIYARIMLGQKVRDMTGGFRAWSRAGLEAADPQTSHASGYAFQVETAWRTLRAGCVVVQHPITVIDRAYGDSKMDSAIVAEATRLVTSWGIRRLTRRLP